MKKNTFYKLIISLIIFLFAIIIIVSIFARNYIYENFTMNVKSILSKYSLSLNQEILNPIDNSTNQFVTFLSSNNLSSEEVDRYITYMTKNQKTRIRDIYIQYQNKEGSKINSSAYGLIKPINDYLSNIDINKIKKALNDKTPFNSIVLDCYRDELNLSTILPVFTIIKSLEEEKYSYCIVEYNLTQMLIDIKNNFSFDYARQKINMDVSIYDNKGTLLETSKNIYKKNEKVLQHDTSLKEFSVYNADLGILTRENKDTLEMLSPDHTRGLSLIVSISNNNIIKSAKTTSYFIIFIGLTSIFIMLISLYIIRKMYIEDRLHEKLEIESKFEALQSKMNPHFLFNTLDIIVYFIENKESKNALNCINALAYMLRFDLREDKRIVPLSHVLKYLKYYINIMKKKYEHLFSFSLDLNVEDIDSIYLLKYCIQPIIENCFKHNLYKSNNYINIKVEIFENNNRIIINISDDGIGISQDKYKKLITQLNTPQDKKHYKFTGNHIGLTNIQKRIQLYYGKHYGITIKKRDQGFFVQITLPKTSSE